MTTVVPTAPAVEISRKTDLWLAPPRQNLAHKIMVSITHTYTHTHAQTPHLSVSTCGSVKGQSSGAASLRDAASQIVAHVAIEDEIGIAVLLLQERNTSESHVTAIFGRNNDNGIIGLFLQQ